MFEIRLIGGPMGGKTRVVHEMYPYLHFPVIPKVPTLIEPMDGKMDMNRRFRTVRYKREPDRWVYHYVG